MFIGIDLGTSGVKVLLMNEHQQIIASDTQPLSITRPHRLWSEQTPTQWWEATCSAMENLRSKFSHDMSQVRAIGLSGQMHGAVLLNKNNQVLRPAILWNDGRSSKQCETLQQRVKNFGDITGNLIFPGFTAPKILWVKEHEPDVFAAIHKIVLPKDYLRLLMTGEYATDMSDASGTSWLDVGHRRWSHDMLAATELNEQHMPQLYEGTQITGTVLTHIAKQWGIPNDTVVVAGAGDNAASAISVNVTQKSQAFLSLGTSGVFFVADNKYRPNPASAVHTMCHCLPHMWHEMTVHLSAASCLGWIAQLLGKPVNDLLLAAETQPPAHNPIFLPYLSGERTPHNNPKARGVFFGLDHDTSPTAMMQAVLEGVAYALREGQDCMLQSGVAIDHVDVVGGGARSSYWGKILASVLNRPLTYREQAEVGGAYGAARLALLGLINETPESLFTSPPITATIMPDEGLAEKYQRKFKLFQQLYSQLEPCFPEFLYKAD